MLYLGCVTGVFAAAAAGSSRGLEPARVALVAIVLLVPGLIGARLLFVVTHPNSSRRRARLIWERSEGGAALYGGLVMSVALSGPLLAVLDLPFWTFWDAGALAMLVGLSVTRLGCVMNGCCSGRATSGRLALWLPDHRGVWRRRVPTPLLEAAWALCVLAAGTAAQAGDAFPGAVFLGSLVAYGAGRLVLEPTRASGRSGGARVNMIISGTLVLAGCAVIAVSVAV